MTPFIQVTSDGTDEPIRHTVSTLGTFEDAVPLLLELALAAGAELELELELELDVELLQPAIASAAAAQAAAAVILSRTAGVLTSCWQGNQPACTA